MKALYAIDASAYLFRAYFAIRSMHNHEGVATNALYGFTRSVLKLLTDFSPEYVVVVFDPLDAKKTRQQIYPEYKAHRKPCPEDLPKQIEWAKEFCDYQGIPRLEIPGAEADDTIATIAKWGTANDFHVYICSSDKDLCQMVSTSVSMLYTHQDNRVLDSEGVFEQYGVYPTQIIDFLAITGDSSDNIPGIRGFGPKTAAKLLHEQGSLEAILANPEVVAGKKKQEVLVEDREIALLSKKLVILNTDLEIPQNTSFFHLATPDKPALRTFYSEKNFKSLLNELGSDITAKPSSRNYSIVDDELALQKLRDSLSGDICFDTETTSLRALDAELVGIGFCQNADEAYYIPCNGKLGRDKVLTFLKDLFSKPSCTFFGHNVKYDLHILANYEIYVTNISFDTILASYLLNADNTRHSLDSLSKRYLNIDKIPLESLIGKGKKSISMLDVPILQVCEYCCEDTDTTFQLKELFSRELKERHLSHLLYDMELPLMHILLQMERAGIYVDISLLASMSTRLQTTLQSLEAQIHLLAGENFNINSPKQLSVILFEKLGIKAPKKTATGYSTDAEVLEGLVNRYPIAEKLLKYRQLEKLRSTYVEALPQEVNPRTGRIHSTYLQFVATTGRLASQNPNLQNIPIRTEEGRLIRASFMPQNPLWNFLSADYSQVELRILAHLSGDPALIAAFENDEDIHAYTASLIFNVPIKNVSSQQRYQAKAVNFGIIYGQQAFGLAKELNVSRSDAALFIAMYFQRYPRVQEFMHSCIELARKTGKTHTYSGRERILEDINSKNKVLSSQAERLAINSPIQGTAADLIKFAMINISKIIQTSNYQGFMILQIHDELVFELPVDEVDVFKNFVKKEMETGVWKLKVPLKVDIAIGKNWREC